MDSILRDTCESFIRNRDLLKDNFKHEGMAMHLMGAAVIVASKSEINIADYKKCENYIDSKAGVLSSLRGLLKMPMIINMAISNDHEYYFERVQNIHAEIKESLRSKDDRLLLAAMIIAIRAACDDDAADMIKKAGKIYDRTDAAGRIFADIAPYVTAASVAASGIDDLDVYNEEFEACKEELALSAGIGKVPEDLCMLIASESGSAKEKCNKVIEISEALRERKIGLGSGDASSMLASLATLDMPAEDIADAVQAADAFLKEQKGFGFMGAGVATRHMYAAMMACVAYAKNSVGEETGLRTTVSEAITNRYTASVLLSEQIMLQTQLMQLTQSNIL